MTQCCKKENLPPIARLVWDYLEKSWEDTQEEMPPTFLDRDFEEGCWIITRNLTLPMLGGNFWHWNSFNYSSETKTLTISGGHVSKEFPEAEVTANAIAETCSAIWTDIVEGYKN